MPTYRTRGPVRRSQPDLNAASARSKRPPAGPLGLLVAGPADRRAAVPVDWADEPFIVPVSVAGLCWVKLPGGIHHVFMSVNPVLPRVGPALSSTDSDTQSPGSSQC